MQKIIIPCCRLSYPALFKPREMSEGEGSAKYQATILIPKSATQIVTELMSKIQSEVEDAKKPDGAWKGANPPQPAMPVYDGDGVQPKSGKPWGPECAGHWVLRTSSTSKPDVVDEHGEPALEASKVYAGCYCHFSVNIKAYNNKQLGIAAFLNCVGFAKDGEPLEAHASAKEDFAGLYAAAPAAPTAPAAPSFGGFPGAMPSAAPAAPAAPVAPAAPTFGGFPGAMPAAPAAPQMPAQPPVAAPQTSMPAGFGGMFGLPQQ